MDSRYQELHGAQHSDAAVASLGRCTWLSLICYSHVLPACLAPVAIIQNRSGAQPLRYQRLGACTRAWQIKKDGFAKGFMGYTPYRDQLDKWVSLGMEDYNMNHIMNSTLCTDRAAALYVCFRGFSPMYMIGCRCANLVAIPAGTHIPINILVALGRAEP